MPDSVRTAVICPEILVFFKKEIPLKNENDL